MTQSAEVATTTWTVLDQAHAALRCTVAGTVPSAWSNPTPCAMWTATQVLQHAAGDQHGFAAFLTGGPKPGDDPFQPSGSLSEQPETYLDAALTASARAFADVDHDATDVPVPVPPGALPAAMAADACALDAAIHARDLAVATGQPDPLSSHLARALLPTAQAIVEPLRAYGAYGPALEPFPGEDDAAVLLRYLGRDPNWAP